MNRTITKDRLDELAQSVSKSQTMSIITGEEQRMYVGGVALGTSNNPVTMQQFESMLANGTWNGGHVAGMGFVGAEFTMYGSSNSSSSSSSSSSSPSSSNSFNILHSTFGPVHINWCGSWSFNPEFMTNWNSHSTQINFANDLVGLLSSFGALPGWTGVPGNVATGVTAFNDFNSLLRGELTGSARTDAVMNVISVVGAPGAAIGFFYGVAQWGASGMKHLEQQLNMQLDRLIHKHFGMWR